MSPNDEKPKALVLDSWAVIAYLEDESAATAVFQAFLIILYAGLRTTYRVR